MSWPPRRVIQIEFIGPETSADMLALCDDGTIWRWRGYEQQWSPIPSPPSWNESGTCAETQTEAAAHR